MNIQTVFENFPNQEYPYPDSPDAYYCACDCGCKEEVNHAEEICALCYFGATHSRGKMLPPRAGEVLLDELNLRGWNTLDLAIKTDIPLREINDFVCGTHRPSQEQLQQIARVLSNSAELWRQLWDLDDKTVVQ